MGESHGYTCEQTAVGTTNGAGPHNVQLFMLSPEGIVLHCLPGFWHPEDLARELELGKELFALWRDPSLTPAEKNERFASMQLESLAKAPREAFARSGWQGFDAKNELKRLEAGPRDTIRVDAEGKPLLNPKGNPRMKSTNQVMHERMAQRPFMTLEQFDTAVYVDYGRRYYDNNKKVDGEGETFMTPRKVAKVKAREDKRRTRAEANARRDAEREARRAAKRARKRGDRLFK